MAATDTAFDPITNEVLTHRLWTINGEGATTIVHASGSPVVQAEDYNFGLYTPDGDLAISGVFYTLPLFAMQLLIKEIVRRHGDSLRPGDVFVSNDPFVGGIHQSDVQFASPYFYDGELVAWTGCMAHVMDIGGMNPGSWCPTATELYQEGLLIPMTRIVDAGTVNEGLWQTIMANSRLPAMLANDFSAFLSAHRVAQARLSEACAEFGGQRVTETMIRAITRTAAQMSDWVGELPDGDFGHIGYVDHDGRENNLYRVACTLRKRGDRLVFDLTESADAVTGMVNATASGTYGAVGSVMLATFGSVLPWNAGLMRSVEVRTRPNSIVSAEAPMPISAGSVAAAWVADAAAMSCLGKMFAFSPRYQDFVCGPPDGSWMLSQFGGVNQYGEAFATMFMDAQGWGGSAFQFRDGVDTGGSLAGPASGFSDVELSEAHQPMLYLWRREHRDSGGAGAHRGGNGIEFALALHDTPEVTATCGTQGLEVPTGVGVFGASPGGTGAYDYVRGSDWRERMAGGEEIRDLGQLTGVRELLPAKGTLRMKLGDVMNYVTSTGGGYGDPLDRRAEAVRDDVLQGSTSPEAARVIYGVVLGADASIVPAATEHERAAIRARRLAELPDRGAPDVRTLPVIARWAETLALVRDEDGTVLVQSSSSGAILGPLGANWRDAAPSRTVAPAEVGPALRLHAELELRQYLDPIDGRALWVDFERRGDRPAVDFRLELEA